MTEYKVKRSTEHSEQHVTVSGGVCDQLKHDSQDQGEFSTTKFKHC